MRTLRAHDHQAIADDLGSGRLRFADFFEKRLNDLSAIPRRIVDRYSGGAIAYEFEFDITEDNNIGGSISLLDVLSHGQGTIGISAKNDRKRRDLRNFKLVDNFRELASSPVMDRVCSGKSIDIANANYQYPIDGSINLAETLESFVSLVQSGNLIGNKEGPLIPTFSDKLEFTTTLSGTVNPKLTLTPVGKSLQVSGAELSATNARTDLHKVTVALTLPTAANAITIAQQRGRDERAAGMTQAGAAAAAAAAELERQRIKAIDADTETIRRSLLGR